MRFSPSFPLLFSSLALSFGCLHAQAEPAAGLRLPAIFADHMVLQSGRDVAVWGWNAPGAPIQVEFLDAQGQALAAAKGKTAADGRWSLHLPALPASASGSLRFTAGETVKTLSDVLVGEVWLGGGQSNMCYDLGADNIPVDMIRTAQKEVTAANGAIRFFLAEHGSTAEPQEDVRGRWFVVTLENFRRCSAVAWNFAVALREKMPVPVGMVISAVGGTSVLQWMPDASIDACPPGPEVKRQIAELTARRNAEIEATKIALETWQKENPTPEAQAANAKTQPRVPGPWMRCSELYNGMIHGLEPFTLRGILWFQADGDMGIPFAYGELIKGMITAWRAGFQNAGLPFYYIEMNNMRDFPQTEPAQGNDALSIIRQQQEAALELPNVDVVCSIDLSLLEPEPHFPNKKPVGERLALLAFDQIYGFPCVSHSPAFERLAIEGKQIRLHFKYAEGLRVRGAGEMLSFQLPPARGSVNGFVRGNSEVLGFQIRGAEGAWVWAQGRIEGQEIVVWNDAVPNPTEVKYAWAMNPLISIENGAGLPLRPFSSTKITP